MTNFMEVIDLRKLAIMVQLNGGVSSRYTGENDYLETRYNVGKARFIARLNSLITRFPKSIRFGV